MDRCIDGGMDRGEFYEGKTDKSMGSVVRGGGRGGGGEGQVRGLQRRNIIFRGA